MTAEEAVRWLLMAGVIPLWIAAGFADWWCHRRTSIQTTSGLAENVFHWILLGEAGVAIVAVAFLENSAGLLLLVLASFLAHELTTYIELRYTVQYRQVRPAEQMVHSFMELLPLLMLALLAVAQWDTLQPLFGRGAADWALRPKGEPWPLDYLVGAGLAVLLFNVLPMAEEMVRCVRAKRA